MYTVYQMHPQQQKIYNIFSFQSINDAKSCARQLLDSRWRAVLVQLDNKAPIQIYESDPRGVLKRCTSAEKALESLCKAQIA